MKRKAATSGTSGVGRGRFAAGIALLGVAAVASWALSVEHLGGLSLPGCGEESACGALTRGPWGRIPLVGWPVSFLGLAYFAGWLAAWIGARGVVPDALRHVARAGAGLSVLLATVMLASRQVCPWCLAVHVANIAFLLLLETVAARAASTPRRLLPGAAMFAGVTLLLGGALAVTGSSARRGAEAELETSTRTLLEQSGRATGPGGKADGAPFTGRWHRGPSPAPIRLVVFSDFQCVDCNRIEDELRAIMASRSDVSLSTKHFPFSNKCNPAISRDMHPNACWAARAAEAAGILAGNDGYWRMHDWLFDHDGGFTDAELHAGLDELGFDRAELLRLMESDQTLQLVQADAREAVELGLHYTPMIFANGVEIRGWTAPQAVTRAVEALAATNPPALTAASDRPPRASDKYVADWRAEPVMPMPFAAAQAVRGPESARVQVVVFGDDLEDGTKEADRLLRSALGTDARYAFIDYPFDQECNAFVSRTHHPGACRVARAAVAAGHLGGDEAYWKLHAWLMENPADGSDTTLRAAALAAGVDADALLAALDSPDVAAGLADDVSAGKALGINALPTIYVDGRRVPRWKLDEVPILPRILAEAAND